MAKKTSKKTTKKTASKGEGSGRVRLADLTPAHRTEKAEGLIRELYNHKGEGEEAQVAKRKLRARLRTIDENWLTTHAKFIERNWPPAKPEKAA